MAFSDYLRGVSCSQFCVLKSLRHSASETHQRKVFKEWWLKGLYLWDDWVPNYFIPVFPGFAQTLTTEESLKGYDNYNHHYALDLVAAHWHLSTCMQTNVTDRQWFPTGGFGPKMKRVSELFLKVINLCVRKKMSESWRCMETLSRNTFIKAQKKFAWFLELFIPAIRSPITYFLF